MKQEEKHIPAMLHAMIQVRDKVKKMSAEIEQLKSKIEADSDHHKMANEEILRLIKENMDLQTKLSKAMLALRHANYGGDYYDQKPHKAIEVVHFNRETLKEIEGD